MKQNVLHTIRASRDSFSKGQKRIADYILNNYDKAAFMTAARLGQTAQVSESTVVRFAAELGYSGYPAMQKALQEIIRGKLTSVQRIYILGVRSSSFLAGYLNFYFHLLFKNVIYVQNTAAGEIYEQMIHIGPGDVMVGISFPRYSNMGIHAIQLAHDRGADVVAITDSQLSPLYPLATAALLGRCEALSYVDSLAAPLSLINALILAVGQRKRDEVAQVFADMEQVWSKYSIFGKAEDE